MHSAIILTILTESCGKTLHNKSNRPFSIETDCRKSSYRRRNITDSVLSYHNGSSNSDPDLKGATCASNGEDNIPVTDLTNGVFNLEIGNDIEELKRDRQVRFAMGACDPDSDGDESWESGFLDQQEASSAGSSASSSSGPSLNSVESRSSPKKCPEENENVMTEAL
ncbi:hypothetical protein CAPTEDRAFT_216619 [Capitella teleta]|uniref:Uncharacterized protein n=1 Tax=Capitella teleta TaxID=283909 RepID=R7UX61_CAPTE|nr:hypothetical protein CAPTEDRAFT_216619 [Capitella teleta]|eukprot:ELU07991.1 hypothetical protein CAPTEDRAFT_216619 [Capitella teleta]